MARRSAGLLLYRVTGAGVLEVLLAHPGGPFWARKDLGSWSVPKGEYEEGDDPFETARREFTEETGFEPPAGEALELGELVQPSRKHVTAWAVEGDLDPADAVSNTFELEWPKGSGRIQEFPEVDRLEWVGVRVARDMLLKGQVPFLDRLVAALRTLGRAVDEGPPRQGV